MKHEVPHNLEAEQALLGAVLMDNSIAFSFSESLSEKHFYDPIHSRIYSSIKSMIDKGQVADGMTLHNLFKSDGSLAEIGGASYLAVIINSAADPASAPDYAKLITDLAIRRDLIAMAEELSLSAYSVNDDIFGSSQIIEEFENRLIATKNEAVSTDNVVTGEDMLQSVYDNYAKPTLGFKSGITEFDKNFGVFGRGKFVVMGARPSMGKSAFGITLAHRLSLAGAGVGFDSMDMDLTQIQARMMSMVAYDQGQRIEYEAIERKEVLPHLEKQMKQFVYGDDGFNNIVFNGKRGKTLSEVIRNANAFRAELRKKGRRLDVLFIDHLQCIDLGGKDEYQAMNQIIRKLKTLAQRLECCIVAFSQLNRESEKTADKIPRMSNFRGTGAIEEEADAVLGFVRPAYYLQQEEPDENDLEKWSEWKAKIDRIKNQFIIYVLKNRQGKTGKIQLHADMGVNLIASPVQQSNIMELIR